jgi:hypothetical protein
MLTSAPRGTGLNGGAEGIDDLEVCGPVGLVLRATPPPTPTLQIDLVDPEPLPGEGSPRVVRFFGPALGGWMTLTLTLNFLG